MWWYQLAERAVAAAALLALCPLMAAVAAAIAFRSGRSPLIRHMRAGWRGRSLPMLKFRSMWDPAETPGPFRWIESVSPPVPDARKTGDPRVPGRLAALCRRYSIDELPQLWHVVCGEMSFVGPRPVTWPELEQHYKDVMDVVLSVRPGLTGLWQTMGRSRLTYRQRRRLDLMLVRKASPSLHAAILIRSVPAVLTGRNAA